LRFAGRGTGDGAKLANCGNGEKEKFGEKGRESPPPPRFGGFSDGFDTGEVQGGTFESVEALVSPGLGFDSELPASEGLCVCTAGGWVADVGVGGICCDWVDVLEAEVVALRLLFG
jgi:hypothetical protein